MAKTPANSGKPWTKADERTLKQEAKLGEPTKQIAKDLSRSESAIRAKASEMDVSLMPKDK